MCFTFGGKQDGRKINITEVSRDSSGTLGSHMVGYLSQYPESFALKCFLSRKKLENISVVQF